MGKNEQQQLKQQPPPRSVKDVVYKLQLALLEGINNLDHLYLAGSVLSRSNYNDVVTERSIANLCGYPLCSNALPSESSRPRKGRYRISLKEHKVYDLHETYMYCSSRCVIESKAFAQGLNEESCDVLDFSKVERVLRDFGNVGFDKGVGGLGEIGDLGISRLKIEEKSETHVGDLGLEDWAGPSNAIEGYVPKKERISKPFGSKKSKKEGYKGEDTKTSGGKDLIFNEMDFMSTIITSDEYSVSKYPPSVPENGFDTKLKESQGTVGCTESTDLENEFTLLNISYVPNDTETKSRQSKGGKSKIVKKDEVGIRELPSTSDNSQTVEKGEKLRSSLKPSVTKKLNRSVTWADEKIDSTGSRNLCEVREMMEGKIGDPDAFGSMHKPSAANKVGCSISWVDEKIDSTGSKNMSEVREAQDAIGSPDVLDSSYTQDNERFESAEACAMALSQASVAVASGESANDAVSEAGIIILPHSDGVDEEPMDVDMLEPEQAPLKWPRKPGNPQYDLFDSEDSWFDPPPEGFSLTLSPFATMWDALFTWITSSTLAYIYGRDENFHEEFFSINGREYPHKIVLADGRSSEIKKTLAESLARALPGVVSELRLATPVSSLEQGMGRMLDTMSFIDALPAFRMKQWQAIVLLFIEGLSVCRVPALTPHMTNRRMLFHKVLDGARISAEEYEVMKDLIIPLGRAPRFSAQSGA